MTFGSPKHDVCLQPVLLQMLAWVNLSVLLRSNASAIISTGKDFVGDDNGKNVLECISCSVGNSSDCLGFSLLG